MRYHDCPTFILTRMDVEQKVPCEYGTRHPGFIKLFVRSVCHWRSTWWLIPQAITTTRLALSYRPNHKLHSQLFWPIRTVRHWPTALARKTRATVLTICCSVTNSFMNAGTDSCFRSRQSAHQCENKSNAESRKVTKRK